MNGSYDARNYCSVVEALSEEGFSWSDGVLVDRAGSERPIDVHEYSNRIGNGGMLIVNPRQSGEVVLVRQHDQRYYCFHIGEDGISLTLRNLLEE